MEARNQVFAGWSHSKRKTGVHCTVCGQSPIDCGGTHGNQEVQPLFSASGWTIAGLPNDTVLDSVPGAENVDVFLTGDNQGTSRLVVDALPPPSSLHPPDTHTAGISLTSQLPITEDEDAESVTLPLNKTVPASPPSPTRTLPQNPVFKRGKSRRRKGRPAKRFVVISVLALAMAALILLVLVLQAPPRPQVTIRLTPVQRVLHQIEQVNAVLRKPGTGEAAARLLTVSIAPQKAVAHASGTGYTQPVSAHGSLTLTNESRTWQTIPAGTSYVGRSGMKVATDVVVQVPPVNLTTNPPTLGQAQVPAHSQQGGAASNISALDIDACCAAGIAVRNFGAFSGGKDGQPFPILQPSDIQFAATPLIQKLTRSALTTIRSQVTAHEQLVANPNCTHGLQSSQGVGAHVESTTVQVQVTCVVEVYRSDQVQAMAWTLLQNNPSQNQQDVSALRSFYASSLTGTKILHAAVSDVSAGTITLTIWVQGSWVRQFRPEQRSWMQAHLAGKKPSQVHSLLSPEQGIDHVAFSWQPDGQKTFPTDPTQIIILIQPAGSIPHT